MFCRSASAIDPLVPKVWEEGPSVSASRRDMVIDDFASDAPASATGVLAVNLAAIAANWKALAALVAPAECAAVVKANAYGLGAARVIPALRAAGCRTFFVATLDEAIAARTAAPGASVLVLDGLLSGAAADFRVSGAVPVLSSLPEIHAWAAMIQAQGKRHPCALHLDTGLNRLGLSARDVHALAGNLHMLDMLEARLVMSHLACADDPASPKNEQQRGVFDGLLPLLPSVPASLAASDGLMLGKPYHYDLVRPGYALYGGQAFGGGRTPVEPAIELHVKVLQVRDVAPGQSVGYSATWTAKRQSRIAIIAAGYADGLFRHLSRTSAEEPTGPLASVAVRGQLLPIVGRVSMDLITIDITDVTGAPVNPGDLVEVIGPSIPIEALGAAAGTIGYEVLTSLGGRFHRLYKGAA